MTSHRPPTKSAACTNPAGAAFERAQIRLRRHPFHRAPIVALNVAIILWWLSLLGSGGANLLLVFLSAIVLGATSYELFAPWKKQQDLDQWALEEQEHITMASLTGKSPEELQQLLEYHLKYGNVQEADRISQKLMVMVDRTTSTDASDSGTVTDNPQD